MGQGGSSGKNKGICSYLFCFLCLPLACPDRVQEAQWQSSQGGIQEQLRASGPISSWTQARRFCSAAAATVAVAGPSANFKFSGLTVLCEISFQSVGTF